MNLHFSVLGKLVFHVFVIREICINLRVICEPTTFAGINFHFFGDFSVIKARKLHQTTDVKPAYSPLPRYFKGKGDRETLAPERGYGKYTCNMADDEWVQVHA